MANSVIPFLEKFKTLWTVWDLRGAVLLSLLFQVLLLLVASSRKRTGRITVTFFLWSAYLLADWVATFAIGLIASGPGESIKRAINDDLNAFWASFLLGHLGGPHTITAFALEDNELWIRHLLQLIIHLLGIAYVFYQSLPNELWVPISLVYVSGFIKYAERTRALYLASMGTMKTSSLPEAMAGSNYARLMQAYRSKLDASVPVDIISAETVEVEPPTYTDGRGELSKAMIKEIEVVQHGYNFFDTFKGLVVDITYGKRDWQKTREFFFRSTAIDTYRIMEAELNFLYDLLYTKMPVVHNKKGLLFRFACLACVVAALERFFSYQKHRIDVHDINITYALLIGAIGLDILAFIMLIFSDWTIASLADKSIDVLSKCCNYKNKLTLSIEILNLVRRKRWAQCVSQYSLMDYCLNIPLRAIDDAFHSLGAKDPYDEFIYKEIVGVKHKLKEFIFKEMRAKAVEAKNSKDAKEICSWRGEGVLLKAPRFYTSLKESVEVEYDESVLRWHVATELLYYTTEDEKFETKDDEKEGRKHRHFCKVMSQYMLYLMIMRPTMMSAVTGIVKIRFQDTCAETKKFFRSVERSITEEKPQGASSKFTNLTKGFCHCFAMMHKETLGIANNLLSLPKVIIRKATAWFKRLRAICKQSEEESSKEEQSEEELSEEDGDMMKRLQNACDELLKVDTIAAPNKVKAGTSKSVLFDACIMAKDLKKMEAKERWEIMSKVWVELLCYAASHCRAYAHAQQLSKGGEFLTFVWLLMIHFGIGEPFRVDPESRYKLVVAK